MMTDDEDRTAAEALGRIRSVLTAFDRSGVHGAGKVDQSVPGVDPVGIRLRLRDARRAGRWSIAKLADRLQISAKTLARYERGTREPDATVIAAICRECGVTADWLLFGHGEGPRAVSPSTGTEG